MANTIANLVGFLSLLVLIQKGNAYEFQVGGSGDWSLTSTSYNQWAEKSRFQIGDSLFFKYQGDDSVLEVSKDDYNNCNTKSPIARHNDGHTVIKFDKSGPHYFISGISEHCKNNEKVLIVVMSDRTHKSSPESPPSPAPKSVSSNVMSMFSFIGAFVCFLSL